MNCVTITTEWPVYLKAVISWASVTRGSGLPSESHRGQLRMFQSFSLQSLLCREVYT